MRKCGKDSDKVAAAVTGVRKVVDKVRECVRSDCVRVAVGVWQMFVCLGRGGRHSTHGVYNTNAVCNDERIIPAL